jgi:hypothetical protein
MRNVRGRVEQQSRGSKSASRIGAAERTATNTSLSGIKKHRDGEPLRAHPPPRETLQQRPDPRFRLSDCSHQERRPGDSCGDAGPDVQGRRVRGRVENR